MRPTFDQTVSILVKAYLDDELAHSFCSACAVGNIVANAIGTKPKRCDYPSLEFDNNEFDNGAAANYWYDTIKGYESEEGYAQIFATGYTCSELLKIEMAFELSPGKPTREGMWRGKQTDPTWVFKGLMAVVDVLADIHGINLTQKEEAKLLFQK